jgi:hypothetical protein
VKAKTKPTKRSIRPRKLPAEFERRKLQPVYFAALEENTSVLKIVKEKLVDVVKLEGRMISLEAVVGKDETSGMRFEICDLKDTVNGNEGRKLIGLGSQIRDLGVIVRNYWNGAKLYILGLSALVLILVAMHMEEVGTALGK